MLFSFLRYLQPTSYFSLKKFSGESIYPVFKDLPIFIKEQLLPDSNFISVSAREYDLSWQAIQKGYIGTVETYKSFNKLPLEDEYHFISKYFNRAWVVYVLLIRILSFRNPFKELRAFLNSRKVCRSTYLKSPLEYQEWNNFKSLLVQEVPKVSVIIPTLNRYLYLKDVLEDLEKQDYKNFEVLVMDQSEPFQPDFYKQFDLELQVSYQKEKALWLARNTAIKQAKGDCLLFFDDDSRVDAQWISNHLKCLDYFKADLSSGVSISKVGAKVPANYCFFRVSDQLDTGNVLIKKRVFEAIGLFDRQFEKQRMGDGEYGLRAYVNGFLNISNPYAKRLHLKVGSGGLREMGSWDAFRTKKWFAPRPIPSVLYLYRRYFGNQAARRALWKTVPLSIMPYQFKSNKPMLVLGALLSILLLPVVLFQVFKSWHLASKKIKQGPLIEKLE
ncbi:glycosyltransferase family 2 protein [Formosa maritima]|uniref:Glycosyltransferase family 2 protein n=1 Tax=Formosa maritima TaxID=2592046 RepID=A0A5D0GCN6_9FLAO|nr:glycosyltransferase family A protein [Formosa maritima]TYA56666.1 glycosyltransferase family 2 protein [Formosa maritima]